MKLNIFIYQEKYGSNNKKKKKQNLVKYIHKMITNQAHQLITVLTKYFYADIPK